MVCVCQKAFGKDEERKQEAMAMVMVGSYIDAEQDEQSTATPTFGILHSERRWKKLPKVGRVRAHTAKRSPHSHS